MQISSFPDEGHPSEPEKAYEVRGDQSLARGFE